MKYLHGVLAVAALALATNAAAQSLYVVRVGDGGAALSNASTPAFVQRFTEAGSLVGTINLPVAANGANLPLTMAGTSTSEGFISLSTNGDYLMLGGYGAVPGMTQVAQTTSAAVNRVVGRITLGSNEINTTTALTDAYSNSGSTNSPVRSVASTNGVDIWTAGTGSSAASGGVRYTTLGSTTSTQLSTAPTNTRVVDIVGAQLYVGTGSAGFLGPSTVGTGTPTATGETTTLLSGFPTVSGGTGNPSHSPYDFWFKDANTVYVADDGTAPNGGGIQKWTQSAGAWSLEYILMNDAPAGSFVGAATTAVRGLTGTIDGSNNAVLFATTTQNSANNLITITDTGATATATTLASAPTNTAFRGVQFVGGGATPENNADFNSDNVVNGEDFLIWQRGFGLDGQTGKTNGNANADTVVDGLDFDAWKAKFGGPPAVAAAAGVPEPGTLALAILGLLGAGGFHRHRRR